MPPVKAKCRLGHKPRTLNRTPLSLVVHAVVGITLHWLGEFASAQAHLEQAGACYDPEHHRDLAYHMGQDPGLLALALAAETLWCRGYPDQALERVRHALSLAQARSHPFSLAETLGAVARVHLFRREGQEAHAHAETLLTLAHEHGFAFFSAWGTSLQGWALVERAARSGAREQGEAGLVQIREGLAARRATGAELLVPLLLGAVAQGYGQGGQVQEGLRVIAEALALVGKNEERWNEAELYRLKAQLRLQQESKEHGVKIRTSPQPLIPSTQAEVEQEAEECLRKAIDVARAQQAKSWELRATVSLAHLWHQQGKRTDAHQMLSEIYNWFTEGFDTKDLQEARALLAALRH